MADIEDSSEYFRRNFVVYCSFLVFGAFLDIPLAKVIERLLGVEIGQVSPDRVLIVQAAIFFYLAHRYYFASAYESEVSRARERLALEVNSARYQFVLQAIANANDEKQKWHSGWSAKREEFFADCLDSLPVSVSKVFNRQSAILNSSNPTLGSPWSYSVQTSLLTRGGGLLGIDKGLKFSFPRRDRFRIEALGLIKTATRSYVTTEHFVPWTLTGLAIFILITRLVAPTMFATMPA